LQTAFFGFIFISGAELFEYKYLPNGEMIKRYDRQTRNHGIVMICLGLLWIAALLTFLSYQF
jgi:hypothetical protein